MRNWAGNYTFTGSVRRPTSVAELQDVIAPEPSARVVGSRHSFTAISDAPAIIDLGGMPERFEVAPDRRSVVVDGAMTYGRLVQLLEPVGLALQNLASLPHISIAGAVATGTHGSGDGNGNLATAVAGVELVAGDGELHSFRSGTDGFGGVAVSVGAVGVIVALELDVEPAYEMEQRVYDDVLLDDLADDFDSVFGAGDSVSCFTDWDTAVQQTWVKRRTGGVRTELPQVLLRAAEASEPRHPIRGLGAEACTDQLGVAGSWAHRLPHFRLDHIPSVGDEIQSEFFVDRSHAVAAVNALRRARGDFRDALQVSEIRTIAGDDLWLSPHYGRDSIGFHFTWIPDQMGATEAARTVAIALADVDPRPHWGKLFDPTLVDLRTYPRLDDFRQLVNSLDADGTFRNRWYREIFER